DPAALEAIAGLTLGPGVPSPACFPIARGFFSACRPLARRRSRAGGRRRLRQFAHQPIPATPTALRFFGHSAPSSGAVCRKDVGEGTRLDLSCFALISHRTHHSHGCVGTPTRG